MAPVSKASDLSDSGDRTDDLGEDDEAWYEAGTATGFAGSWLPSGLGCLTSTGLVGVTELAGTDEPGEPLWEDGIRECSDLGLMEGGWTAVPWAWVREGSGGAATR